MTKQEEVTPSREQDENEMCMCAECLGHGRIDGKTRVYCNGVGRVLTVRARMLRQQRAERLANAAPALYEALKTFAAMDREGCDLNETACTRGVGMDLTIITSADFRKASEAIALVDVPQETK
jgi:hypothetical protein